MLKRRSPRLRLPAWDRLFGELVDRPLDRSLIHRTRRVGASDARKPTHAGVFGADSPRIQVADMVGVPAGFAREFSLRVLRRLGVCSHF